MEAVFWITDREYDEVIESARRMRVHMPDMTRVLFCTDEFSSNAFDQIVKLPPREADYWYLDSIKYFNQAFSQLGGFGRILYLDTDVYVIAPFPELMELLDRYDVVGVRGARRITGAVASPIPHTFTELEIGVTAFKSSLKIEALFKLWLELHHEHSDIYGNNDQRSFREALWKSPNIKLYIAPPEYGLRWPFGCFMSLPVKILHGRLLGANFPDSPTLEQVERIVNEHLDMRIWSPRDPDWRQGVIPQDYERK